MAARPAFAAAASRANSLVSGFNKREWSLGLLLRLPWGLALRSDYSSTEKVLDDLWVFTLDNTLMLKLGKDWKIKAGLSHDTENGSGDNQVTAGVTYYY
jgi:hypothetical protein